MYFHKSHLWLKPEGEEVVAGLTFYGQAHLGLLVYADLPAAGLVFNPGDILVGLESKKTVWELKAPLGGRVAGRNEALAEQPALLNDSPFERGWLLRLVPDRPLTELPELLTEAGYQAYLLTLSED